MRRLIEPRGTPILYWCAGLIRPALCLCCQWFVLSFAITLLACDLSFALSAHQKRVEAISRLGSSRALRYSLWLAMDGREAVPLLRSQKDASSWRKRYWAVRTLGLISSPASESACRIYLRDRDVRVRLSAILALRELDALSAEDAIASIGSSTTLAFRTSIGVTQGTELDHRIAKYLHSMEPTEDRAQLLVRATTAIHVIIGQNPFRTLIRLRTEEGMPDSNRASSIKLYWFVRGQLREQSLSLPQGWCPRTWIDPYRALISAWPAQHPCLIRVYLRSLMGMTGDTGTPLFYARDGNHWRTVNRDVDQFAITDYDGTRFDYNTRLAYVWKRVGGEGHDPLPHRYRLRVYRLKRGHFRLIFDRITKKKYSPLRNSRHGTPLADHDDPLREFGLHWSWWQYHL